MLLSQSRNIIGRFMKTYLHRPVKILQFVTPTRIQKYLTFYSSFFNNVPPAVWVVYIKRDFLYMFFLFVLYFHGFNSLTKWWIKPYVSGTFLLLYWWISFEYFMLFSYAVLHNTFLYSGSAVVQTNMSEKWIHCLLCLCKNANKLQRSFKEALIKNFCKVSFKDFGN